MFCAASTSEHRVSVRCLGARINIVPARRGVGCLFVGNGRPNEKRVPGPPSLSPPFPALLSTFHLSPFLLTCCLSLTPLLFSHLFPRASGDQTRSWKWCECGRRVQHDSLHRGGYPPPLPPPDPSHLLLPLPQVLNGPADTPYAGGIFKVDIVIPSDYPFSPPKMRFITKGRSSSPLAPLTHSRLPSPSLASQCLFSNGRYLSGHPEGSVVSCSHHQDRPALLTGTPLLA